MQNEFGKMIGKTVSHYKILEKFDDGEREKYPHPVSWLTRK
jgi:hypothetical protein